MTVKGQTKRGGKNSKERISVLLCCSAMGENLKPFIIGKSQRPRCFRGKTIPNQYAANKKSWMTSALFKMWLDKLNNKMKTEGRNILLFLDRCTVHPDVELSRVRLQFLPPNTTARLQPCDARIICAVKATYRRRLLRHLIFHMDGSLNASDLAKKINLLGAISWLNIAWDSLTAELIMNCFKKCGFHPKDSAAERSTEVEIVDCQAITMDKKELVPVDTQAPTVEKSNMVNSTQRTKLRPTILTLRYKISDPNSKIIPFLPKERIEKSYEEAVKFGRTETFDVFLNDECMSRNYIHIYAEKGDPSKFTVINFSTIKPVIVDNYKLEKEASCYIKNKSVLQLDIITFSVSIQYGDSDAERYIVHVLPAMDSSQQICRSPSFQMQNFGTCNQACCYGNNSLPCSQPFPYVHNLHCQQMSPQIQNSAHWQRMSPQIHNSPHASQMSPQIHNSSHWIPAFPQVHNFLNNKPESHVNKIQPPYSYPDGKGLSRRQPQEHAMSSEDPFYSEKQKQYQLIEDMSRK